MCDKPNNKDLPEFENLFSEKSKISNGKYAKWAIFQIV